jgi:hypothetical protein
MPYNRTAASKLLTASELALFDAGRRDAIGSLDERTLKSKVERTRRLRDKYRDLARRQRLATRERTGTKRGTASREANARTAEKETLFAELLVRFETRLAGMEGRAPRTRPTKRTPPAAARKAPSKAPRRAAGKSGTGNAPAETFGKEPRSPKAAAEKIGTGAPAGKRATEFMSSRAKGLDTERQRHKSRGTAIQAHLRSQGRRSQAKRDSRG